METAQNSSDNLPSYLQTTIIAQMLSSGGGGGGGLNDLYNNPCNREAKQPPVRQSWLMTRSSYTMSLYNTAASATYAIHDGIRNRSRKQRQKLLKLITDHSQLSTHFTASTNCMLGGGVWCSHLPYTFQTVSSNQQYVAPILNILQSHEINDPVSTMWSNYIPIFKSIPRIFLCYHY